MMTNKNGFAQGGATAINAVKIVKDYTANGLVVHALRELSLTFGAGEFAAIAGPSGSGKSTFLHLAGCLDTLTAGSMEVGGRRTDALSKRELALLRRHSIGFIFQAYNLIPVLSAEENVSFPLVLLGVDKAEAKARTAQALEQVGLAGLARRRPKELSGGQQQRIAIARALVKRPALILADEPTANLDSATGREILETMLHLNRAEGTTFIFSTHDPMVMEFARRVVYIRDGMIERDDIRASGGA
ncbi:MAG: ABC transporter ATP-binding protein [Treponema sp.]|jgi:putative ABC transport system ATP-binding protein|nr:ABC transporter ATP-binding protein [Treponema sp.]